MKIERQWLEFHGAMTVMIPRAALLSRIRTALGRRRVVALVGPRQCGKTTLARVLARQGRTSYFDLEDPRSLSQLAEPMTGLEGLRGLIVIDEVQLRTDLFPVLRVQADRRPLPARFLILGSASPALLRQSTESLAAWRGGNYHKTPYRPPFRRLHGASTRALARESRQT
jgi:predicted AAA+ superfamily ATPase